MKDSDRPRQANGYFKEIKTGEGNYTTLSIFYLYCCCYKLPEKKYFSSKIALSF